MKEIWSELNAARGRKRWCLKEMMDGARFRRRLDQTLEEIAVILSVSWQLEVPSWSPSFWILERLSSRFILSFQIFIMGFCTQVPSAATAQEVSRLQWRRKEIESVVRGIQYLLVSGSWLTLGIFPTPEFLCLGFALSCEVLLIFPSELDWVGKYKHRNHDELVHVGKKKNAPAVSMEHLDSSYSTEKARRLHQHQTLLLCFPFSFLIK